MRMWTSEPSLWVIVFLLYAGKFWYVVYVYYDNCGRVLDGIAVIKLTPSTAFGIIMLSVADLRTFRDVCKVCAPSEISS